VAALEYNIYYNHRITAGHIALMEKRHAYKILVGKPRETHH
jgi:hypothetical protein